MGKRKGKRADERGENEVKTPPRSLMIKGRNEVLSTGRGDGEK